MIIQLFELLELCYDIGAVFAVNNNNQKEAIDLVWKSVIDECMNENTLIRNSNAAEDDSHLGVTVCERVGLVKVAMNFFYSK